VTTTPAAASAPAVPPAEALDVGRDATDACGEVASVPTGYSPFAPADIVHVLLADADGGVYPHRVTVRDRVLARVHADRWDRALARGASPESSAPLALHAQTLASARCRRELAASLTRILDDAQGGHLPDWNALGPRNHHVHVLAARREIEVLVGLLLASAPVGARGVALARLLLTDGGGPLYRRTTAGALAHEISHAVLALDPTADWTI
jgi:hypothetical protein